MSGHTVLMDPSNYDSANPGYKEIFDLWTKNNIDPTTVKWTNYYPEKHFDKQVVLTVSDALGVRCLRSWISRVDPGYQAPWHYDVDDNEAEYLAQGNLRRFSAFIMPPHLGHVFTIKTEQYYDVVAGNLYEWDNYRDWHEAKNTGSLPHFMFHILGVNCT